MSRPSTERSGRSPVTGALLLGMLVVLLGSTVASSWSVWRQTDTLEANVELTGDIVEANIRTLGQVQRELLRFAAALEGDDVDADTIELHRALVTQRMREAGLAYQRQALGSAELLEQSRSLAARWLDDLDGRAAAFLTSQDAAPGATDAARVAFIEEVRDLELGFNRLAADGEANRKLQAASANSSSVELLADTRVLLLGLLVTLTGFVALTGATLLGWRRLADAKEAALAEQVELSHELRKLSRVASSTDNMVVITDAGGRVEWVNEAFERVTGYELEDVVGTIPGRLLQGPDTDPAVVERMRRGVQRGEGFNVEVLNYSRTGTPYWVQMDVQPVVDGAGQVVNFIAVQSDVSDRRAVEAQLRRAKEAAEEMAQEKATFLASMSHEIRTPLNAVIGLTGMLLDTDLDDQQRQYATTARKSGGLLLELLNNILNFSALEAGKVVLEHRPTDLSELVADTCALFGEQVRSSRIDLEWRVDDDVPARVLTDPTRLRQVLINLVANAVKFTSEGGVTVSVSRGPEPVDGPEGGPVPIAICVADTGPGIPDDRLHRLFRPFSQVDASTTRKHGGTGLGLAISRQLVTLMGGEVQVQSTPGVGSRFRVVLALEPAVDVAPDPAVATETLRPLQLLLAEDDMVNQLVALHMLERLGHEVVVVNNGREALDALDERDYDVVLMDVHMPELDGVEATRQLRGSRMPADQPRIVAMTANALEGDRERFLAEGMDDYVSKPVSIDALSAALARAMELPHGGSVPVDRRA